MTVICSGSLAFDRLADYPGLFSDNIIADKINLLNVCFMVDSVHRVHGGTAGNIAYNLSLLGVKPLIITAVGDDPDGRDYLERLRDRDLATDHIPLVTTAATAGAYIASDRSGNQLLFFNPGAMQTETDFEPANLPGPASDHLAIVSPGGFKDMLRLPAKYRELGIKFIFDPGQQIPAFSGEQLLGMLDGSVMLMTNEYELEMFKQKTNLSDDALFHYTSAVLTTLSSRGSRLSTPRGTQHIMPVPVASVGNPTGAGDAYRAGVLAAMIHGEDILSSCRLGSTIASFCVEAEGTQDHRFTPAEVLARHFRTFKQSLNFLG
ncbi:MAG: carbohydrate kinase family protein [Deltaproteobacteria bacterium]|jgi:adenosine kinase|nr:carbohydrate kinase family protein [Deltaproteobacteria bacterium]